MDLDQAISHFGTAYKLCKALNIRCQNVTNWKKKGRITYMQQVRIEKITNGALKAEDWRLEDEQ